MNGASGRILLLMKEPEAAFFRDILHQAEPRLAIHHTPDTATLAGQTAEPHSGTRLIAFSTQVIVPAATLRAVAGNAYNFHPGPPAYPGSKPSAFAVYQGARSFGVTLHRMAARVDSGPIVETRSFPIAADAEARAVATQAYTAMARLALERAAALADIGRPLPENGELWTGRKWRMADYEKLRRIDRAMPAAEIKRRLRACDGIYSPLPPAGSAGPSSGSG